MADILIMALIISTVVMLCYYFGIKVLYKYRVKSTLIFGFLIFSVITGYNVYKEYQEEKQVETVLTEVTTEINNINKSIMSDEDFHHFVESIIPKKDGVQLDIVPKIDTAILKVNKVYQSVLNDPDYKIMITSANDSKAHNKNSAHYNGRAVDIRINNINPKLKKEIVNMVNDVLGPEFFVLHEAKGKPNEHLHIQLKNKKG